MSQTQFASLKVFHAIPRALMTLFAASTSLHSAEPWASAERDGRLEISHHGQPVLAWQVAPIAEPVGGAKFAASAFIHPLRTPAGFECTQIQPADHLHHLGFWWPWKHVQVDGKTYNTWEIQEGQGGNVARTVKPVPGGKAWELRNESVIKKPGGVQETVIVETTRMELSQAADTRIVDLEIRQKAAGPAVTIPAYRYSGFSWRGPASWNRHHSTMLSSGGHSRDTANGQPARWLLVTGETPQGTATVLILSAAEKLAGTPEKLRVWDSKAHEGATFANFNPVQDKSLPLDDKHPAVSHRKYRIILADREIKAAEADAAWTAWLTTAADERAPAAGS
jgi:hypothetical protein